jgi:hypothetical protein
MTREVLQHEPVAWMYQEYRPAFMGHLQWFDEVQFVQPPNDPERFRTIVPLYAAPPQRPPLKDEEIETIIRTKHFSPAYVKRNSDLVMLDWYRLGLRDGEAAHGIGACLTAAKKEMPCAAKKTHSPPTPTTEKD